MRGIRATLKARRLAYDILIQGKYTMLQGMSGTGKTRFVRLASQYTQGAPVEYTGPGTLYCAGGMDPSKFVRLIETCQGDVFLMDEEYDSLGYHDFLRKILTSPNYFIIVSREGLRTLPYGVESLCVMEGGPAHYYMSESYPQRMWRQHSSRAGKLLCEDEGNGYECAKRILQRYGYSVDTAKGKDKIVAKIKTYDVLANIVVAVDVCGLSCTAHALFAMMSRYKNLSISSSRSFEWCALQSEAVGGTTQYNIIDAAMLKYRSEESYYEGELSRLIKECYGLAYKKNDSDVCSLLCSGRTSVGKQVVGRDRIVTSDAWLYPDIPRAVKPTVVGVSAVGQAWLALFLSDNSCTVRDCTSLGIDPAKFFAVRKEGENLVFDDITYPIGDILSMPELKKEH